MNLHVHLRWLARLCVWLMAIGLSACQQPSNRYVPPPPPEVTVQPPVQRTIPRYAEFTGTIAALEHVEVRARVKGFVDQIHFKAGAAVKVGDLLFTIDPRPFEATVKQAQAEWVAKKSQLGLAQATLDKNKELAARQFVSDIELRQRIAERDVAAAEVGMAQAALDAAQLDLEFTAVKAPISGYVSRNLVDKGALVGANGPTLLATLINDKQVYVYFTASEQELLNYRRSHPKREADSSQLQPVFLALADETDFPHEGQFDSADTQVDPRTGTLGLRARFSNEKGLLVPGLFVRVRIPLEVKEALLVPDVAVAADQAGRYVLVVNEKNIVERRNVQVGTVVEKLRPVLEGLQPTEQVVINGLQRARPGSPVTPKAL